MARLNGSFPAIGGQHPDPIRAAPVLRRWHGAIAAALLAIAGQAGPLPEYVRQAIEAFNPGLPAGWAYTLTTQRNDLQITERFDPGRPLADQWTLLRQEGRAPTAEEIETYAHAAERGARATPAPVFQREDLDLDRLTLMREDATQAEFVCGFCDRSMHGDRMLGHLVLHLHIAKHPPHVTKFTLELQAPYSPTLGVKMNRLTMQVDFSPPDGLRPSLPAASTSVFLGRVFFFGVEENLRLTYSDFVPVGK